MASKGLPVVLAVEVAATWPTASACRSPTDDCGHGRGKLHLGRRTDRFGAAFEAGHSRLAADSEALHANQWSTENRHAVATMENVRAQPCERGLGGRFLHGDLSDVRRLPLIR